MPVQYAGNFLRIMVLFVEPPPPTSSVPLPNGAELPPPPPVANHTSMNLRVTGAMGGPPPQCLPIRLCCRKAATGPSGAELILTKIKFILQYLYAK